MSIVVKPEVILKKLRKFCDKYDTYTEAATALNVTPSQLSLTLNGKAPVIPARILDKLGYETSLVYVRKGRTAVKRVKVSRSAKTGKVVTAAHAKANPDTTVTETQKRAVTPKAKKTKRATVKKAPAKKPTPTPTPAATITPTANPPLEVIDVTSRD